MKKEVANQGGCFCSYALLNSCQKVTRNQTHNNRGNSLALHLLTSLKMCLISLIHISCAGLSPVDVAKGRRIQVVLKGTRVFSLICFC